MASCGWPRRPAGPRRQSGVQRHPDAGARPPRRRGPRRTGDLPRAGPLGLLQRGPVPPGGAARRHSHGAPAVVQASTELAPVIVVGAPVRAESGLFNAAIVVHRDASSAPFPRAICLSITSTTRNASSGRRVTWSARARPARSDACRSAPSCCSRAATFRGSRSTSRSARTCGPRSRRAPTARWRAPPCSPTCRPATSRSARPATAGRCARRSRPGPSPATSTPPRAWASRPPTWPGTARH